MTFLRLLLIASLLASFALAQDAGWGIDPNGASTDSGPGMDPNGSRICYTACIDPNG